MFTGIEARWAEGRGKEDQSQGIKDPVCQRVTLNTLRVDPVCLHNRTPPNQMSYPRDPVCPFPIRDPSPHPM